MRCRYCGVENPDGELRCQKCQRRLMLAQARPGPETYPVVETALAPALLPQTETRAQAGPALAVQGGRTAPPAVPPTQASLFAHRLQTKVVGIEDLNEARPATRALEDRKPRSAFRRKPVAGQSAFDFAAPPPSKPFTRETDSAAIVLPVAPLTLRAMAALFDAAIVLALSAIPIGVARFLLGDLPLHGPYLGFYVATPLAIAFAYKLAYCLGGGNTPGLQGTGLRLVSFDGRRPSHAQRVARFVAGWLSLAPGALGLFWALADQDTFTWHDHITQTFLTAVPEDRG